MTENRCFEKVDFSSLTGEEEFYDCRFVSCDFSEVPEVRLRKAVFPEAGLSGLLAHLDIKIV